jgi:hypothetical protein
MIQLGHQSNFESLPLRSRLDRSAEVSPLHTLHTATTAASVAIRCNPLQSVASLCNFGTAPSDPSAKFHETKPTFVIFYIFHAFVRLCF